MMRAYFLLAESEAPLRRYSISLFFQPATGLTSICIRANSALFMESAKDAAAEITLKTANIRADRIIRNMVSPPWLASHGQLQRLPEF